MIRPVLLLLLSAVSALAVTPVTISDVVVTPVSNRPAQGSFTISWPSFTEQDGSQIPAGSQTVTLRGDGSFTVSLPPTDQASLSGTNVIGGSVFYSVVYQLATGASSRDRWNVPTTSATLKIANVLVPIPGELKEPVGLANPNACAVGDLFYNTTQQSEQLCVALNTWLPILTKSQTSQQFLSDSATPGLVMRGTGPTDTHPATPQNVITALGYMPPNPANNLSEYANSAPAARTSLGLGTIATKNITDFLPSGTLLPVSVLPAAIPATSITGLGTAAFLASNTLVQTSMVGASRGVAPLDVNSLVPLINLPPIPYGQILNPPVASTKLSQLVNDVGFLTNANLAKVALTGDYNDLTNIPTGLTGTGTVGGTITNAAQFFQVANTFSELTTPLLRAQARTSLGLAAVANSGNWADILGKPLFANVATSGQWSDILNRPNFGTIVTANLGDYLTTLALGTTVAPLDATHHVSLLNLPMIPATQVSGLPASALSGSYGDLLNIPTNFPAGGNASGDLCATYPAPVVCGIAGANITALTLNGPGLLQLNHNSPASLAGPVVVASALGFMPLNPALSLGEVVNITLARTHLGLGTAATYQYDDFLADSGGPGLIFRGQNTGITRTATPQDFFTNLGYIPLDQARLGTSGGPAVLGTDLKLLPNELPAAIPFSLLSGAPNFVLQQSVGSPGGVAPLDQTGVIPIRYINGNAFDPIGSANNALSAARLTSLQAANNLSDLTDPTAARLHLLLGSSAILPASAFVSATQPGASQLGYLSNLTADVQQQINALTLRIDQGGGSGGPTATASGNLTGNNFTVGDLLQAAGPTQVIDSGKAPPSGAIVGTTDVQTLTNKSIAASEVNSGVLSTTVIPAEAGDVSKAAGSATTTLATVLANPGTFGDSSHSASVTVDTKGRVTSISTYPITGSGNTSSGNVTGANLTNSNFIQGASGSAVSDSGKAIPSGAVVGTTDAQTLSNKAIDAAEITTGILNATLLPALTGDVSKAQSSNVVTLPLVNPTPGACGDATHVCAVNTDGKGRVLTQSAVPIVVPSSSAPLNFPFTSLTTPLTMAHTFNTRNILVACYDTTGKYLEFGSLTVTDVSHVVATFAGTPSGSCVINGGVGPAGTSSVGPATGAYTSPLFTNQTSVTLTHNLNTRSLVPTFYDNNWNLIYPKDFRSVDVNTALVTFATPQSGYVVLDAGLVGAPGSAGANGTNGSNGAAATVAVGTVTTGAAGSQATVTNTGTAQNAVLSFSIPQGAQGIQGAQGPQGAAGTGTTTGSTSGGSISSGTLASMPSGSCAPGVLYQATDQTSGSQIYYCLNGSYQQLLTAGPSGAISVSGTNTVDASSIVPTKAGANTFTGVQSLAGGMQLTTSGSQPACSSGIRGMFWFVNGGTGQDHVQVCAQNSSGSPTWTQLF